MSCETYNKNTKELKVLKCDKLSEICDYNFKSLYKLTKNYGRLIIPTNINKLIHLQSLDLSYSQITIIPKELFSLTNLSILILSGNRISKIPNELSNLINLKELKLDNNKLIKFPTINKLIHLKTLFLSNNKIKKLPYKINKLKLEYLYIANNNIKFVSKKIGNLTKLKLLYLSYNNIVEIPKEISNLQHLYSLSIDNNSIERLPLEISRLNRLDYFHYNNNPIENLNHPIIRNFINRYSYFKNNIYNDRQNVHSSSIQESLKKSIKKLFDSVNKLIVIDYYNDNILTHKCKELLTKYSSDKSIHSELECSYTDVLYSVFHEISFLSEENQKLAKMRLNEEIMDSEGMCFTGKLTRLINSLSCISDKVEINISDNEQIGNIITIISDKYKNDVNKIKEEVIKELKERKYDDKKIQEWIDYIE